MNIDASFYCRLAPEQESSRNSERREFVRKMMKHAWAGYKKHAWGHDHLHPISHGHDDWFGLGLTILDALDTLYIMDLKEGICT